MSLHKLTIINGSTNKSFSVCLQCANDSSDPANRCYEAIRPSSSTIITGSSPTGNLFIIVDNKEVWKGLIPTDNIIKFSPEMGILSDDSGEIPAVFVELPPVETRKNKVISPTEPPIKSSFRIRWWIVFIIVLALVIAAYIYTRRVQNQFLFSQQF